MVLGDFGFQYGDRRGSRILQAWHPCNCLESEMETVELVQHSHVERCRCRPLLDEATDMDVAVVRPFIGEPVNEIWVAVISKDYRPIRCEQCIEIRIRKSMRMMLLGLQAHEIDDIDHADTQIRDRLTKQHNRRHCLHGWNVSSAGHNDVWLHVRMGARPIPRPHACFAMRDSLVHRQPLWFRLFPGDDNIDPVIGSENMVPHPKERVGIRGR